MADNVVFITALPGHKPLEYLEYGLATWRWWCARNGVRLFVFDRPVADVAAMKPMWQKYFAFKVLAEAGIEFDRIAIVDADTMVRWDCPDFFELAGNDFAVTVDHDSLGWVYESMRGYQHLFPGTEVSWLRYFNSGFIVASTAHKGFFYEILAFYHERCRQILELEDGALLRGYDQTPVNFLTERLEVPIRFLPKTFNLTHLGKKDILRNWYFIDMGYVWHFNGVDLATRCETMRGCWEKVKGRYAPPPAGA